MTTNHTGSANAERLPAFRHQPELRALMMLDALPPGCISVHVPDDRFAPHLREGELAVVDTTDVEPTLGEFFVIAYDDRRRASGYVLKFVEPICRMENYVEAGKDGERDYWTSDPAKGAPREFWEVLHEPLANAVLARRMGRPSMIPKEGPFTTDHLRSKLLGRVVGIYRAQPGGTAPARHG